MLRACARDWRTETKKYWSGINFRETTKLHEWQWWGLESWVDEGSIAGVSINSKNWVFYKSWYLRLEFFISMPNVVFFIKMGSFFYKKSPFIRKKNAIFLKSYILKLKWMIQENKIGNRTVFSQSCAFGCYDVISTFWVCNQACPSSL